jgi:hypothetical protein
VRRALRSLAVVLLVAAATIVATAGPAATGGPPAIALLTSVSAQDMGTFDRVTFTFEKGTPTILSATYEVGPAVFAPSGEAVVPPIAGVARLVITMSNAADEDLTTNPPDVTYPGPFRFPANLPNITELVQLQDFEATLTWAIGVNDARVTAVSQVLFGPTRVQVDIPHGSGPVPTGPNFTG